MKYNETSHLCCFLFRLFLNFLQRKIDDLKEKISVMRTTAAERGENLQKELQTQTHLKEDIEVMAKHFFLKSKRMMAAVKSSNPSFRKKFN